MSKACRGLVLAALVAAGATGVAAATIAPTGADFRISNTGTDTDSSRGSFGSAVAYNPTANQYLAVWDEDGSGPDEQYEIFGQVLSATGAEVGSDFQISNAGANRDGSDPAVAYDPAAGEYLVVWSADELTTDDEFEIFGQRVSSAGAEVGGDFRISNVGTDTDTAREANHAAVAFNPASNQYLVSWNGDSLAADVNEIFGQLVGATGAEVGSDFRISNVSDAGATRDADLPSIAYNSAANEFLVAFTGDGGPADEQESVYGQRVSAAGVADPQGDVEIANLGSDGDPFTRAFEPTVAYNTTANRYLVAWEASAVPTTHEREVFGQIVSAGVAKVGGIFQISDTLPHSDVSREAFSPVAAYSPAANEYVVVWEADGTGVNDEFEVSGSRVSSAGGVEIADFRVSRTGTDGDPTRDAFDPAIAYNSTANEFLVTFTADGLATENEFETFGHRLKDIPKPAGKCKGKRATVVLAAAGRTTVGTKGRDVIVGNSAANRINSRGGNDLVCAGGGKDTVRTGGGKDMVLGGAGGDKLSGQGGKDKLSGQAGKDRLLGGGGGDKLLGGAGKDMLVGGGGKDRLFGGPAADFLRGGAGKDRLSGGPGRDNQKQ